MRWLYFAYFGGVGLYFPFINVYFQSIGLSGTQIGLIGILGPVAGILCTMLLGMFIDRFGRRRLGLGIVILGQMAALLALSAVRQFGWVLLFATLFTMFNSPIIPFLDSTTLSLLGEQRDRYGQLRVWGTIGFIITTATAGSLYTAIGLHSLLLVYAAASLPLLLLASRLPNQPVSLRTSLLSGLKDMVRRPAWLVFAMGVFLIWMAAIGGTTFLGPALKGMGASDSLIGLAWTMAALTEFPVFLSSSWLLRNIGHVKLVGLSFIGYILRLIFYSLMPSPNWVLAANMTHGISFVPLWIGATAYANKLAPEHLKATSQSLFFSISNLATMAGGLLAGTLFDVTGPASMFRILAGCCGLALILFTTGRIAFRHADAA
jgi:PPP family 3-phenylpropionic acid transporter